MRHALLTWLVGFLTVADVVTVPDCVFRFQFLGCQKKLANCGLADSCTSGQDHILQARSLDTSDHN